MLLSLQQPTIISASWAMPTPWSNSSSDDDKNTNSKSIISTDESSTTRSTNHVITSYSDQNDSESDDDIQRKQAKKNELQAYFAGLQQAEKERNAQVALENKLRVESDIKSISEESIATILAVQEQVVQTTIIQKVPQNKTRSLECADIKAMIAICVASHENGDFLIGVSDVLGCDDDETDDIEDIVRKPVYSVATLTATVLVGTGGGIALGPLAGPATIAVMSGITAKFLYDQIKIYQNNKNKQSSLKKDEQSKKTNDFQIPKDLKKLEEQPLTPESAIQKKAYQDAKNVNVKKAIDESQKQNEQRLKTFHNNLHKLENNLASTEQYLAKKGIQSFDDSLPIQRPGFDANYVKNEQGRYVRDKEGNYFTTQGNIIRHDPKSGQWVAQSLNGSYSVIGNSNNIHKSTSKQPHQATQSITSSTDATPIKNPTNTSCGHKDPTQDFPTSLPGGNVNDVPRPKTDTGHGTSIGIPTEIPGCGSTTPIETITNTAHGPTEATPTSLPGFKVLDVVPSKDFILQAKADNSKNYQPKGPNGTFRPSAKHHQNSPGDVGKPPRNGQSALDNSFPVEDSKERIAIQDGNVVILKYEEDGIYHGYIAEDITTLNIKVRKALVKNDYIKDPTSKKLIKK